MICDSQHKEVRYIHYRLGEGSQLLLVMSGSELPADEQLS